MWDNALSLLLSPAIPAWAALVIIATRAYRSWPDIMQRWNERRKQLAAEKDGDWARLRDEIKALRERLWEEIDRANRRQREADERHQAQETENERCQHDLATVRALLQQEISKRVRLQNTLAIGRRNPRKV